MSGSAAERGRFVAAVALTLAFLAWSAWLGHGALALRPWIGVLALGAPTLGMLVVWIARSGRGGRRTLVLGALVALAARLLVTAAPHPLSDDIARYRWDGRVLAHGIDPYRYAPSAPELDALRRLGPPLEVNHADLHTVYPPLAQLAFAVAWWIDPLGLGGFRVLTLAAELATAVLLARLLARGGQPLTRLALLGGLPLVVLEGYGPGHVDTLAMPLVVAALASVEARRPFAAGTWLALAALIKPFPLLMLPAALRELGVRGSLRFLATLGVVAALGYAPFLDSGHQLFDSTWLMARTWVFNGSIAPALAIWLGDGPARLVAGLAMAVAVLSGALFGRSFRQRVLLALAAFVAFTPTLYPWYLVWALPFLVLEPAPALLAIVVLSPVSYLVLVPWHERGAWELPGWVPVVEYVPFYALLAHGAWRRRILFGKAQAR